MPSLRRDSLPFFAGGRLKDGESSGESQNKVLSGWGKATGPHSRQQQLFSSSLIDLGLRLSRGGRNGMLPQNLACFHVPDPQGASVGPGEKLPPVRRKTHRPARREPFLAR